MECVGVGQPGISVWAPPLVGCLAVVHRNGGDVSCVWLQGSRYDLLQPLVIGNVSWDGNGKF